MFRIEDGRFTPFPLFAETVRMEMDMSDMRIMLSGAIRITALLPVAVRLFDKSPESRPVVRLYRYGYFTPLPQCWKRLSLVELCPSSTVHTQNAQTV